MRRTSSGSGKSLKERRLKKMVKVCVLATPPDRCGIGKYVSFLTEEMRKVSEMELVTLHKLPVRFPTLHRVVSEVIELKPDIIHIHFDYPFFGEHGWQLPIFLLLTKALSKLRYGRCPRFIVSLHEFVSKAQTVKGRFYTRIFNTFLARWADAIVALSHTTLKELLSSPSFANFKEKVYLIPHGSIRIRSKVDKHQFERKYGLSGFKKSGDLMLGVLGFIHYEKGHDLLLKALRKLKGAKIKLVIAGKPRLKEHRPYYRKLINYCKRYLNGSVRFIGFIEDEDIPAFFDYIDVLVLPYRRIRQSGILNLALAHGTPVITSDLPEFEEIRKEYKCVLTFKRNSSSDLARKIKLARSERLRTRLTVNAKKYHKDNSLTKVAKTYTSLYKLAHKRLTIFDLYGNEQQRERIDTLRKLMKIIREEYNRRLRILEVGCGTGYVLNEVGNGDIKVGIDMDEERLEFAINYYKINGVLGDARKLPFKDKSFDVVLLPEILEHLEYEEADQALREALRVARDWVIITLPNASKRGYDKNLVENPEHRWFPTFEKVLRLITKVKG
ncbi:MAG TPA: glycosyltransferase, partial [Candidatus Korarchaeota archaeon]|nr:glycosyltransferase [Candidatus Korarchaeota archaeon]